MLENEITCLWKKYAKHKIGEDLENKGLPMAELYNCYDCPAIPPDVCKKYKMIENDDLGLYLNLGGW